MGFLVLIILAQGANLQDNPATSVKVIYIAPENLDYNVESLYFRVLLFQGATVSRDNCNSSFLPTRSTRTEINDDRVKQTEKPNVLLGRFQSKRREHSSERTMCNCWFLSNYIHLNKRQSMYITYMYMFNLYTLCHYYISCFPCSKYK